MMKNIKKITTLALALTLAVSNFIFTAETISAEVAKTETTVEIPALTVTPMEDIDISDEKVYPIKTLLSEKEEKDDEHDCIVIVRTYDCIYIDENGDKFYSSTYEKINKEFISSFYEDHPIDGTIVNAEDFEKLMDELKLNRKTTNDKNVEEQENVEKQENVKEQENVEKPKNTSDSKVNKVLATKSLKKNIKTLKIGVVNRIRINVDENDTSKTKYRVKFKIKKTGIYSFGYSNLHFDNNENGELIFDFYENSKSKKKGRFGKLNMKTYCSYKNGEIGLYKNDTVYLTILKSNLLDENGNKLKDKTGSYEFDFSIKYEEKGDFGFGIK